MTPTEYATVASAITAGITAVLTLVSTKGIDAFIKYRKQRNSEQVADETQQTDLMKVLIGKLEARVELLEARNEKLANTHLECERNHARLEAKVEHQALEIARLQMQVAVNSAGHPIAAALGNVANEVRHAGKSSKNEST